MVNPIHSVVNLCSCDWPWVGGDVPVQPALPRLFALQCVTLLIQTVTLMTMALLAFQTEDILADVQMFPSMLWRPPSFSKPLLPTSSHENHH